MPLLSVIVPVYNEAKTISRILEKINSVNIDKEIVVVDDGSSDDTGKILHEIKYPNLKIIYHATNRGKGAAFLTGLSHAEGEFVIIQDADLEYDPNDYFKLMDVMEKENADIVLGARFMKGYQGLFLHRMGNRFLTKLMNVMFGVHFNDCFTCYKLVRRQKLQFLNLQARGFDIDMEIIAKALKNKLRISETLISYNPRSYAEGKKIRCKDGISAALSILKYRLR